MLEKSCTFQLNNPAPIWWTPLSSLAHSVSPQSHKTSVNSFLPCRYFALLRSNVSKDFTFPLRVQPHLHRFLLTLKVKKKKKKLGSRRGAGGSVESPGPPDVWTQLSPVTLVTTGLPLHDRRSSATAGLRSCQEGC